MKTPTGEIDLKLVNDEHYYGEYGSQYLSNSSIKNLLTNPANFGVKEGLNVNLLGGRYFHQLILEPEKAKEWEFVDASTRNTKIYKEFVADLDEPMALLQKEAEQFEAMVKKMKSNFLFYDAIYEGEVIHEEARKGPVEYDVFDSEHDDDQNILFKGKADIVRVGEKLIDLKTTSDIQKFQWSAKTYNYDSQAYIYQSLFGLPMEFYVIDKITLQLGVFTCSEDFLASGRWKVSKAIEIYKKYYGENPYEDIENHCIQLEL
jgi:hypothetical protein